MSVTVKITGNANLPGLDALAKRLRVGGPMPRELVGVPSGLKEEDGTSLALVAARVEFGGEDERELADGHAGPAQKVQPERPFMRQGIRSGVPEIRRVARHDLAALAEGHGTLADVLDRMGAVGAGAVKKYMAGDNFAPNAPSTIAKKGSEQPTIASGSLRQQITHVPENA